MEGRRARPARGAAMTRAYHAVMRVMRRAASGFWGSRVGIGDGAARVRTAPRARDQPSMSAETAAVTPRGHQARMV
jgi:hypothetical protein